MNPGLSAANLTLCLVSVMLAPLAAAGLAIIHQGLGRSRSAAHAMLATLCALAIAAIVFVIFGSGFFGYGGGQFYSVDLAGITWNTLGAEPFFAAGIHFDPAGIRAALGLCFMVFAAGIVAIIPISAGTDRWRMIPICCSTALLIAFAFPLFAHWTWAAGWLGQLPAGFALPGLLDTAGAGTIHVVGGLAALSIAWILGPRRAKYTPDGMPSAIPGHNIVMVLFGCLLTLVGWIGLSAAAALLFAGAQPEQIAAVILNAALSAGSGCLASVVTTRIRYRKPDASLSANGWVAGLVAGSAASGFVAPAAAIFTGLVAGVLVAFLVEIFELHLLVDDPGGAISVHAGAGIWGLVAAGLFAHSSGTHAQQLLVQLVGIATLLGVMLPLIHLGNLLLNRFVRFRVDSDGDWQGMDIRELGAGAYPEFVIHADEFVPR